MDTKTKQAIDLFQKGDFKKALSIFKTFKVGFTKQERDTIITAYEILTGKESFYRQLGIDTKKEVEKAKDILKKKYSLKESEQPKSNYKLSEIPDGVYEGKYCGYEVYMDSIDSGFKTITGIRTSFPQPCKVYIKNGLAKIVMDTCTITYSSEEAKAYWNSLKPKELAIKNKADNMSLQDQLIEKVVLDIEKGDTILTGKFKNKKVIVKDFGTDDKGQPTINGKPILKIRIQKLMNNLVKEDKLEGGKSDSMSLEDIAQDHLQRMAPRSYADDTLFSTNADNKEITYNALLDQITTNYKLGLKVEMEHTNDGQIASEIVKDHLMEDPVYYQKLSTIETMEESIKTKKQKLIESLIKEDSNWEKQWSDKFEKHFSQLKNKDDIMDSYYMYASQLSPNEKTLSKILIAVKNKALKTIKNEIPSEINKNLEMIKKNLEIIIKTSKDLKLKIKPTFNGDLQLLSHNLNGNHMKSFESILKTINSLL